MKASIAGQAREPRRAAEGDRRAALRSRGRARPRRLPQALPGARRDPARWSELFADYRKAEGDVATAEEMARDPTMRDFAEDEIRAGRERAGGARSRAAGDAAAARPQRRQEPLPRDPRRHRRRRERALRGRPLPHVLALRRAQPLAGRDRLREPGRGRRLQGDHRAHRRAAAPTRGSSSSPAATACSACPPPRRRAASTLRRPPSR